jgi:hypothetical protein
MLCITWKRGHFPGNNTLPPFGGGIVQGNLYVTGLVNAPQFCIGTTTPSCITSWSGVAGAAGSPGVGVPTGGTQGQALVKNSSTNYDTGWQSISSSGGSGTTFPNFIGRIQMTPPVSGSPWCAAGNYQFWPDSTAGLTFCNNGTTTTLSSLTGGGVSPSTPISGAPLGAINGTNTSYSLAYTPIAGTLQLLLNGINQVLGSDYTLSGSTITYIVTPPQTGDTLWAVYSH